MSQAQLDLLPESRADQIFKRFCAFHCENPELWTLFLRFTRELIGSGRERYAVAAVIERIRWHVAVETKGTEVKINNDFRAYYARMFMACWPEHGGFFELRRRLSAERPAYAEDLAVFHSGDLGDERTLMEQLRRMGTSKPEAVK